MSEADINAATANADEPGPMLALQVLARLVRDEYPPERTLAEIAEVWGNASADEIDALRAVEGLLSDPP